MRILGKEKQRVRSTQSWPSLSPREGDLKSDQNVASAVVGRGGGDSKVRGREKQQYSGCEVTSKGEPQKKLNSDPKGKRQRYKNPQRPITADRHSSQRRKRNGGRPEKEKFGSNRTGLPLWEKKKTPPPRNHKSLAYRQRGF